jgi:hypothetical protein
MDFPTIIFIGMGGMVGVTAIGVILCFFCCPKKEKDIPQRVNQVYQRQQVYPHNQVYQRQPNFMGSQPYYISSQPSGPTVHVSPPSVHVSPPSVQTPIQPSVHVGQPSVQTPSVQPPIQPSVHLGTPYPHVVQPDKFPAGLGKV